eukprot:scaffold146441_cov61-Attheya_sp.AAC.4
MGLNCVDKTDDELAAPAPALARIQHYSLTLATSTTTYCTYRSLPSVRLSMLLGTLNKNVKPL